MSTSSKSKSIRELFNNAHRDGAIGHRSLRSLNVTDIGAQIQAGLGIHIDDITSSEVVLLTMMPDDSGSIRFSGNASSVRGGHNLVLDALAASRQADSVLAHTRYLNGEVLFPYSPISQAVRMTAKNYDPVHGTPLFDQTVTLLATVLAKAQELIENGVAVRTVTLIITDGADQHSIHSSAADVHSLVRDMERSENHIVAAMGVDDGTVDFRQVFQDMGLRDQWILTVRNDADAIRRAFQVFSQSASAVVQSQQNSTSAVGNMGGFMIH